MLHLECPSTKAPACSNITAESCGLCYVLLTAWIYDGSNCVEVEFNCDSNKEYFQTKYECEHVCGRLLF